MSAEDAFAQRVRFLQLGPEDLELLADLEPTLKAHADRLVAAFYRHLLSFEPTARLLEDPEAKDRLLVKQREYLLSLAGPGLDPAYARERTRIGVTHERVGLEPQWYLGAYSLYFSLIAPLVCEQHHDDPERGERTLAALVKLLTLDSQLAMEAYIDRREHDLARVNEQLAQASRHLARQVEERVQELRATERRARAAEELAAVATLAAGLAHEIGTPMGVIRGHAELLEKSVSDEKGLWRVRTIQEQIDRISRIMEALLDVARPHTPDYQPTCVASILEETLSFLGEKFRRRGIQVTTDFDDVPTVLADREKLHQVFLNLYLNAADAMPEGGELRIRVAPDGPGVVVRIADTGAGISEDVLPHVFEPFYTTKEAGTGNGLGLVVARSIVADHGGSIEVTSSLGEGTEFSIHLPTAVQPADVRPDRA